MGWGRGRLKSTLCGFYSAKSKDLVEPGNSGSYCVLYLAVFYRGTEAVIANPTSCPSTPNSSCCHYSLTPLHHTADECSPSLADRWQGVSLNSSDPLPPLHPRTGSLSRPPSPQGLSPSALFLLWPFSLRNSFTSQSH